MLTRTIPLLGTIVAAGLMAGCASDTSGLATSSVMGNPAAPAQAAAAMPPMSKVDPACVTLLSQIESMRKDGVSDRVQKASTGKAKTVSVKRATLVKAVELDKLNAEYQAKCSTLSPRQTAAANPVADAVTTAATNAATNAATGAASKAAGSAVSAAVAKIP